MVICSGSDSEELHIEDPNKTSYTNVEITTLSVYYWILTTILGLSNTLFINLYSYSVQLYA